jgi:hypothetical protein
LSKEEYDSFVEAEAQYGDGIDANVGELSWEKDQPAPASPPPSLSPTPAAQPENKDLKEILKAVGRFDALTRSLDTRLKAVERMGPTPSNGDGAATSGDSPPPSADDESMDDVYKMMASNLKMLMMKSMVESLQPKPAPVPQGDGGHMAMLREEIKDLKRQVEGSKSIEPQLINSLQSQVEAMRSEAAHRDSQKILQAIMATRQQGPSELQTYMAGLEAGRNQSVMSSGQDAFYQSQAEFARAGADLLRGDGSSPVRGAARDVLDVAVQTKKNELLIQQNRARAIAQGRDPDQPMSLEEMEADINQMEADINQMAGPPGPGGQPLNPVEDVTDTRDMTQFGLDRVEHDLYGPSRGEIYDDDWPEG